MALTSVFLGPIVGMVGGMFSQWAAYKSKQIDLEDRKHQREHDRRMHVLTAKQASDAANQAADHLANQTSLEYEGKLAEAREEGDTQRDVTVNKNIGEILQRLPAVEGVRDDDTAPTRWYKNLLGGAQTLVRVIITLYVAWKLGDLVDVVTGQLNLGAVVLPVETITSIAEMIMYGFVELALTAIAFWFGGRGSRLREQKFNTHDKSNGGSIGSSHLAKKAPLPWE